MRLNRYLASAGFGSRRSVESLITEGSVTVNGQTVTSLSTTVAAGDVVKVGNRVVESQQHVHAIINKPKGFICSSADEAGRRTILDLVPDDWPRVYNVGRLDKESEGLLVITNDGDLSLSLTHPRYKVEKEYEVLLDRPFEPAHREKLLRGFHIEGGRAKMERISVEGPNRLRVVLLQGIKRQIRLMMYDCGYEVESLKRVRIGTIWLDRLRPGEWRMLNPKEVKALKEGRNPDPDAIPRPKPTVTASKNPFIRKQSAPRAVPASRAPVRDDAPRDFESDAPTRDHRAPRASNFVTRRPQTGDRESRPDRPTRFTPERREPRFSTAGRSGSDRREQSTRDDNRPPSRRPRSDAAPRKREGGFKGRSQDERRTEYARRPSQDRPFQDRRAASRDDSRPSRPARKAAPDTRGPRQSFPSERRERTAPAPQRRPSARRDTPDTRATERRAAPPKPTGKSKPTGWDAWD